MNVSRVSFTGVENKNNAINNDAGQKQSAMYSKDGFIDLLNASRFTEGTLLGYGMFETIDKFSLVKNKNNLAKDELLKKAKSGTKRNILIGLGVGVLSVIAGKFMDKKLLPATEKLYNELDAKEKELAELKELKKEMDSPKKLEVEKTATGNVETSEVVTEAKKVSEDKEKKED